MEVLNMDMDNTQRLLKAMDRIRDENTKIHNDFINERNKNIKLKSKIERITKNSKPLSNYY